RLSGTRDVTPLPYTTLFRSRRGAPSAGGGSPAEADPRNPPVPRTRPARATRRGHGRENRDAAAASRTRPVPAAARTPARDAGTRTGRRGGRWGAGRRGARAARDGGGHTPHNRRRSPRTARGSPRTVRARSSRGPGAPSGARAPRSGAGGGAREQGRERPGARPRTRRR